MDCQQKDKVELKHEQPLYSNKKAPDGAGRRAMKRKKDLTLITDWMPFLIDGCQVDVFFPSAYEDDSENEARPAAMERTLIAAYRKSSDEK